MLGHDSMPVTITNRIDLKISIYFNILDLNLNKFKLNK